MPLLHVRLFGEHTQINIPAVIKQAKFRLKSYRVLFNRDNHGYFHAAVTCSLFNDGNMLAYVKENAGNVYSYDIPLFIDPENKMTYESNTDWDMGLISNLGSRIDFYVKFYNSIERKRYDQAFFDSKDNSTQIYYGVNPEQPYFGSHIPMYVVNNAQVNGATVTYTDMDLYDANGVKKNSTAGTYPTAKKYVHVGVEPENGSGLDPQPGGDDYDTSAVSQAEKEMVENSKGSLVGSGYRKGPLIYPYSIDLLFEYST
jgi:hypothetical protein